MEQFERVMTTMTGSTEKANQVLDTTNDIVKGTAYGLDVGAQAVQNFVTSNMDVDKATETFAAWGDAVAFYGDGTNETLASVTDALAKMTAKGKVQMDTMNRLTEAGIPAMQIFADATGKSVEEVAAQMQKGELSAEEFTDVMNKALKDGTKGFAGIEGAAKEAGASWSGSFDNMQAAVARGVTKVIESIDEMLTSNGLPDMRQMVADFGSKFEEILANIGESIPLMVEKFKQMRESLKPLEPILLGIASSILVLAVTSATLNTVRGVVNGLSTAISSLGSSFGVATMPMLATIVVIGLIGAAVYKLWQTNEEFRANVEVIWESLKTIMMSLFEAVMPAIGGLLSGLVAIVNAMMPVISAVVGAVATFLNWIATLLETHSWITQVIAVIGAIIGAVGAFIAIGAVLAKVIMVAVSIFKVLGVVIAFLTSPIGIAIAAVLAIIGIFKLLWEGIKLLGEKFEWIGDIVDTVSNFMSNAWNKFLGFFGMGTSEAAEEAESSIAGVAETGQESFDSLLESSETLNTGVTTNIGEMSELSTGYMDNLALEGVGSFDNLNIEGLDAMTTLNAGVTSEIGSMSEMGLGDLSALEVGGIDAMSGLETGVTSNVSGMASNVMAQVGNMETTASGDFSGLASDMSGNATKAKNEVSKAFSGMASAIGSEMTKIKNTASEGMKGLATDIAQGMTLSTKTIQTSMKAISQHVAQGFTLINKVVQTSFVGINKMTSQGTNKMSQTIAKSGTLIQKIYQTTFKAVTTVITNEMGNTIASVQRANNLIVSSTRSLRGQMYSAGIQAMAGLRGGLVVGSSSVMATARSIANNIATTIRSALKVNSPSRVLMEIGKWIGQGLVKGIEGTKKAVDKASSLLATTAIPDIQPIDIGAQVASINKQANRQLTSTLQSNINVSKQPAYINLNIGGRDFEAFVEDITDTQERNTRMKTAFI